MITCKSISLYYWIKVDNNVDKTVFVGIMIINSKHLVVGSFELDLIR